MSKTKPISRQRDLTPPSAPLSIKSLFVEVCPPSPVEIYSLPSGPKRRQPALWFPASEAMLSTRIVSFPAIATSPLAVKRETRFLGGLCGFRLVLDVV